MDTGLAALVVGILAGTIGLISALLAHLSLRFQLKQQAEESLSTRQHLLKVSTLPKVIDSMENAWHLLSLLEENRSLSDEQKTSLVKCTLWLPKQTRISVLLALKERTQKKQDELISDARKELISITNSLIGADGNDRA